MINIIRYTYKLFKLMKIIQLTNADSNWYKKSFPKRSGIKNIRKTGEVIK
jgi:hypothetical protein